MELAHITPVSMVRCQPNIGAYLAISTLVLRYPEYAEFYRDRALEGATVILDNPVHEDGEFTVDHTLAAADAIKPTVIVVPDKIDSVDQTMLMALQHAPEISWYFPQTQLMCVPHAINMSDYLACAHGMSKIRNVTYFGVSLERRLQNDQEALRRRRLRVVSMATDSDLSRMKIHLLGVSERATELAEPIFQRTCVSADTSQFAVWALAGTPVFPEPPIRISYPGRALFGGSERYFAMQEFPFGSAETLRANLLTWTNYAYEKESITEEVT